MSTVNLVRNQMLPVDTQLANEYSFSKKHIDRYIRKEILASEVLTAKITEGAKLLNTWLDKEYDEKKQARVDQVKVFDPKELVLSLFVGISYCWVPQNMATVVGMTASRLKLNTKLEGIQTLAEILTVLCETDVYDLTKENKQASVMVSVNIQFSKQLTEYIKRSTYLPPMVCTPNTITENYQSGYLTHNDSMILKDNHHSDPIALDVINKLNQTALAIDYDFVSTVEEVPKKELDTVEKLRNWNQFKKESMDMYTLMLRQSDKLHLTHRYDMRGRAYANGYHISTQGSSYKKAMLNFAEKEVIDVPLDL